MLIKFVPHCFSVDFIKKAFVGLSFSSSALIRLRKGWFFKNMTEALTEMWSKFSLTEEEMSDVVIEKEWLEDMSVIGSHCLLGKILMRKNVNMEAMKTVFKKIWKLRSGVLVREVGERLFLF